MNLRKGFFRLTLVLSILIGIISAFVMMEREPALSDFDILFREAESTNKTLIKVNTMIKIQVEGRGVEYFPEGTPEEVILEKLRKKYPPPNIRTPEAPTKKKDIFDIVSEESTQNKLHKEWEKATPIDPNKVVWDETPKLPTYTVLKKTVNPIKWNKFFYEMAIGFASIWVIYVFIRWVVVFFVIGGFKGKATR